VNEKRRRAGTGQRGRNLSAYQSRFAHPGHNDLAATTTQQLDRSNETLVETIDHRENPMGLDPQHFRCAFEQVT
jgi:hypothetical protein